MTISNMSRCSHIAIMVGLASIANGCKSSGSKLRSSAPADALHPANQARISAEKESIVATLNDKTATDLWNHLEYLSTSPTKARTISSYDKAVSIKCDNRSDCSVSVAYNLADAQGGDGKTLIWENNGRLVVQWSDGSAQNLYEGMARKVFKERSEDPLSGIISLANGSSDFSFRCSWILRSGSNLQDPNGKSYSCGVYLSLEKLNESNTAAAVAVDATKAGVVSANLTGIDASRLWSKFQLAKQPNNSVQAGPISLKCSANAQLARTCTLSVAMLQVEGAPATVAAAGSVVSRSITGPEARQFMTFMMTAPGSMFIDPSARKATAPVPTSLFVLDSTDHKVKIKCSRNGIMPEDGKTSSADGCTVSVEI